MPRLEELPSSKRSTLQDLKVRDVFKNYSPYQDAFVLLENKIIEQQEELDLMRKKINEILKTK